MLYVLCFINSHSSRTKQLKHNIFTLNFKLFNGFFFSSFASLYIFHHDTLNNSQRYESTIQNVYENYYNYVQSYNCDDDDK